MALVQLVFQSEKTALFDADKFRREKQRFRDRNADLGITGFVVSHGQIFTALLEGREKFLFALMEKIARDKRHKQVTVLYEEILEQARFANSYFGEISGAGNRPDRRSLGNLLTQCLLASSRRAAR